MYISEFKVIPMGMTVFSKKLRLLPLAIFFSLLFNPPTLKAVINQGTFEMGGTFSTDDAVDGTGDITITGPVIISAVITFNNPARNLIIASGGSITIQFGGQLDMETNNNFTIQSGGTMTIDQGGQFDLGSIGDSEVNGGTLNISGIYNTFGTGGSGDLIINLSGTVTVTSTGDVNISDDLKVYTGGSIFVASGGTIDVGDNVVNNTAGGGGGTSSEGTIHIDGTMNVSGFLLIDDTTPNSGLIGSGDVTVTGTFTNSDINDFDNCGGIGATCSGSGMLPIDLVFFEAEIVNSSVQLNWSTSSEINNDFFTIEKSINGKDWDVIRTIQGAGNSNTTLNYSSADSNPLRGNSYYRLKQTDYDGSFEYFNPIAVQFMSSSANIYPNPSQGELTIVYNGIDVSKISLFNIFGQKMDVNFTKQQNQVSLINSSIKKGVYFLTMESQGQINTYRIVFN